MPKLIARAAGEPPEDWVRARLLDGRALVLLDGIDEVPDARRRDIRDSIVERLAWAATRTAPHPYRVITADA